MGNEVCLSLVDDELRPYDEDFAARLADMSLAFYACQLAFRELAEETEWRPAEGWTAPGLDDTSWLL